MILLALDTATPASVAGVLRPGGEVIEAREDLPLGSEPPHEVAAVQPRRQQLDRHLALELLIVAAGQIHVAHAAAAEPADHAIRPDGRRLVLLGQRLGGALEEVAGAVVRRCQLERLGAHVERGVFGADMRVGSVNDGPITLILETPESSADVGQTGPR